MKGFTMSKHADRLYDQAKLVLRGVDLPRELDEVLGVIAFHEGQPKGELMKRFLEQGVEGYRKQLEQWAPDLLPSQEEKG
jgi:hypothetical protein